jgi:hypothetical protein
VVRAVSLGDVPLSFESSHPRPPFALPCVTPMKNTTRAVSVFASLAIVSAASASAVVFNNRVAWDFYTASQGATVATEDFESLNGYKSSATGIAGSTTWTANATGGIYFQPVEVPPTHQVISTWESNTTLNFTFAPGVQGIGGEMFGTDAYFEVVLARITVTLADGITYVNDQTSATDFVGFYSNGATISSISVSVANVSGPNPIYATVDNLYFATVPAPGALALLATAGCVSGSTRRRA